MSEPGSASASSASSAPPASSVVVALVLAGLAVILSTNPRPFRNPAGPATVVPAWATDPTTVRQPTLRAELKIAGFTYRCSDCHNLFPSPPETTRSLTQHRDVVLKHGINTRCFNCHHLTNRDAYVDDWGREIPADQPQLVCAKCHGPVYRDWLHGSHGRVNGYWSTRLGPQVRVKCIQCHDPHQPPFPPMHPAPPPNTLRMGDQTAAPESSGVVNPLRIFRRGGDRETEQPGVTRDGDEDNRP